ncbi:MAG: NTP transferase domain-containing protein [Thermoanaerobaculales bacterium]|nr:NTP transferase domain-containing protein [Thermoanaerobaculales bacterium]
MQPFAGLILAGGAGHRFGGPKAFALLPDDRTFLHACSDAHRSAGASHITATLPPGNRGPVPDGVHAVDLARKDLDMFQSILAGLHSLINTTHWETVIVHPVDHPLVRPATIAALADDHGPASIPTINGRHGHPIRLSREVAERIVRGDLTGPTLREVLREVRAHDLLVDDPGIRANCNTPETLQKAWRMLAPTS